MASPLKKVEVNMGESIKGYVVKVPIRHNGKEYKVGSEIGLTEADAKQLLESKAIEAIKK